MYAGQHQCCTTMGPSPETSHAGLVCFFYINSVGPHYFYTHKFPKQTFKRLLYLHTPFTTALLHSHFFAFSNIVQCSLCRQRRNTLQIFRYMSKLLSEPQQTSNFIKSLFLLAGSTPNTRTNLFPQTILVLNVKMTLYCRNC